MAGTISILNVNNSVSNETPKGAGLLDNTLLNVTNLVSNDSNNDSVVPSTSSSPNSSPPLALFIMSLQIVFALLIICSNCLVLVVFLKVRTLLKGVGKYLLLLSMVDLCTGMAVVFQVFFFFYPVELSGNKWMCILRFQFIACLTLWSLVTLLLVSFERYLSTRHVGTYARYRERKVWVWILLALWLYALAIFLYPLLGGNNWDGKTLCKFPLIMRREQMLWSTLTQWVISSAMVVMYSLMWHTVRRRLFTVRDMPRRFNGDEERAGISGITSGMSSISGDVLTLHHNLRSVKLAFAITVAFCLCWIPYSFVQLTHFLYPLDSDKMAAGDILVFLGVSNSFMNPIIYACMNKDFRRAIVKVFSCQT